MKIQAFNETKVSNPGIMGSGYDEYSLKTDLEISDVNVAFVNCLRRSFSSMVPTVTFDDTYYNDKSLNSIKIAKNTSSLHNEFLSQRLSLLPINIQHGKNLTIKTYYDTDSESRKWEFIQESIPKFFLKKKNTASDLQRNSITNVTTDDFEIIIYENGESITQDTNDYFPRDCHTGDPILINKLKSNFVESNAGEELNIECVPKIDFGKNNARNDPTGTSVCRYKIDNQQRIDEVFSQKIEYLNKERKGKELPELDENEIDKLKKSFNLLDKNRVFITNSDGEPNWFELSVESIGCMSSFQIICDSIASIKLSLLDIKNSFTFQNENSRLSLDISNSISLHQIEKGVRFIIKNENHTIGNILKYYLCEQFLSKFDSKVKESGESDQINKFLKIAGYVMPHPTINELEFKMIITDDTTPQQMKDYIINSNSEFTTLNLDTHSIEELTNIFISVLFIKSINFTINKFDMFKKEIGRVNPSINCDPSFDIADNDMYISKNSGFD